jgi:hypothetical protein
MAEKRNRRLEIAPLNTPLAPIGSPLSQLATGSKPAQPKPSDVSPAFTCESLRATLANSTKLREAAMLVEVLQSPLALRRARHRR